MTDETSSPLTPMTRDLRPSAPARDETNPWIAALGIAGLIGVIAGAITYAAASG